MLRANSDDTYSNTEERERKKKKKQTQKNQQSWALLRNSSYMKKWLVNCYTMLLKKK